MKTATKLAHSVHAVASHKLFMPCQVLNQLALMGMKLMHEHDIVPVVTICCAVVFMLIAVIDKNEKAEEVAEFDA